MPKKDPNVTIVKVPIINDVYNLLTLRARVQGCSVETLVAKYMMDGLEADDQKRQAEKENQ